MTRPADHREVERALLRDGWSPCGAGDWAIALRSPDGTTAARISPFDPTGPYTAALYTRAASTRQVPALFEHRRLAGGGDLQIMEWLRPVPGDEAAAFHQAIAGHAPHVARLGAGPVPLRALAATEVRLTAARARPATRSRRPAL